MDTFVLNLDPIVQMSNFMNIVLLPASLSGEDVLPGLVLQLS